LRWLRRATAVAAVAQALKKQVKTKNHNQQNPLGWAFKNQFFQQLHTADYNIE